jgi:protein SCO1
VDGRRRICCTDVIGASCFEHTRDCRRSRHRLYAIGNCHRQHRRRSVVQKYRWQADQPQKPTGPTSSLGCADICPAIIESLAPAVDAGKEALGEDSFSVVTIGFDTRNDTPDRMRSFARQHKAGGSNWYFLSSDQKTLDKLASTVGFSFFPSAGGFDHMAQVTVLDKTGKIYRQVYGASFTPPQIVEPLKELVFGREKPFFSLQGIVDRVKLFCTVYNPNTGRYYFNYSLFASIFIGAGCLLAVLYVLLKETRKAFRGGKA